MMIKQVLFSEFTIQEFKESNPPNVTVETPTKKDSRSKKGRKAKKNGFKGTKRFPFFKSCDDVSRADVNGLEKVSGFIRGSLDFYNIIMLVRYLEKKL